MVEFIAEYWLQLLFGAAVTALSLAYRALLKRIRQQDAIRMGIVALLRDRMIGLYNHYEEKGFCPIYARDNLLQMYQQYHNLGGNGTITQLVEEIQKLPTEKREESEC